MADRRISQVTICNIALGACGANRISSIDDTAAQAQVVREYYGPVYDAVLASNPWNCATKRAALARMSTTPIYDFSYKYALPTDCLRVLRLYSGQVFVIENGELITNDAEPYIKYVARIDESELAPLVGYVIAYTLASEINPAISKDNTIQTRIEAKLRFWLAKAQAANGQEGDHQRDLTRHKWILARI